MVEIAIYLKGTNKMFIYCDIGGTKTQICTSAGDSIDLSRVVIYKNKKYRSFEAILVEFIQDLPLTIEAAFIAVAGAIHHNTCAMTNINWVIDGDAIAKQFNIKKVHLMNDLSATAYAIPSLEENNFDILQNSGPILENGPIAIISVGTGLGESVLSWDKKSRRYKTISGEGGHRDFAPHNELEIELLKYTMNRFSPGGYDTETLISGSGIVHLYQFMKQKYPEQSLPSETQLKTPEEVVNQAYTNNGICKQVIELLVDLIATEASNVALQYMSRGGVIIAGGIPPRIMDFLKTERFTQRFSEKARFKEWLQEIPICLCTNTQAPILGAHYYSSLDA